LDWLLFKILTPQHLTFSENINQGVFAWNLRVSMVQSYLQIEYLATYARHPAKERAENEKAMGYFIIHIALSKNCHEIKM